MIRPAIFIGLGSTGVRILDAVQQAMFSFSGDPSGHGLFRYIAMDTDSRTVTRGTPGGDRVRRVNLSIRSVSEAVRALSEPAWWPVEATGPGGTEQGAAGRRALGRLSFLRHVEEIRLGFQELKNETQAWFGDESARCEAMLRARWGEPGQDSTWVDPDAVPRVFVAASLCGGTGGGAIGDLLEQIGESFGEVGPVGLFLMAPADVPIAGGSENILPEWKANSITAFEDIYNRWLGQDSGNDLRLAVLASPATASREILGGNLETALDLLVARSGGLLQRMATVLDLSDIDTGTRDKRVLSFGMGGIRYPRAQIAELALQGHLGWLIDQWTSELRTPVSDGDLHVETAFRVLCHNALSGSKGILEGLGAHLPTAALSDSEWTKVQMGLRTIKVKALVRESVLEWSRRILSRLPSFGALCRYLEALERHAERQVQEVWGPKDLPGIRDLMTRISGHTPSALVALGDGSVHVERQIMGARALLFAFSRDVVAAIRDIRERAQRVLARLNHEKEASKAREEETRKRLLDPCFVNVYQGEKPEDDVAILLQGVRVDLQPDRYEDAEFRWFDPLGGGNGADAPLQDASERHFTGLIRNVMKRAWRSIDEDCRSDLTPSWAQGEASRLRMDQIDGGFIQVPFNAPVDRDPIVQPPIRRVLLTGVLSEQMQLPIDLHLYKASDSADAVLLKRAFQDSIELIVLRSGFAPSMLALTGDPDCRQALGRSSEYQLARRPYELPAEPEDTGLAFRFAHLCLVALPWEADGKTLRVRHVESNVANVSRQGTGPLVIEGISLELPEKGLDGFGGLVRGIEGALGRADSTTRSNIRRQVAGMRVRYPLSVVAHFISQIGSLFRNGSGGKELTVLGQEYKEVATRITGRSVGDDLTDVFLKTMGVK